METKIDLQLPIIGKELLSRLRAGRITMDDFNKECAFWMMGDISSMFYKEIMDKPDIIRNYEAERSRDPKYEVAASFWQRDDVRDYMFCSRKVMAENYANWHWLLFMRRWMPKEDTINCAKIARAITSYHNDGYVPKDDWRNR